MRRKKIEKIGLVFNKKSFTWNFVASSVFFLYIYFGADLGCVKDLSLSMPNNCDGESK